MDLINIQHEEFKTKIAALEKHVADQQTRIDDLLDRIRILEDKQ